MRGGRLAMILAACAVLAVGCGVLAEDEDPLADLRPVSPDGEPITAEPEPRPSDVLADEVAATPEPVDLGERTLVVDLTGDGAPFDRRLLGSNLPAWLGPERDAEPHYHPAIEVAGVELLRFPGGSWSNEYDWLACLDETDGCFWPWAKTVEDFARVMTDVADGTEFVWTVHYNGPPEEAAALVAFFNAEVGDPTVIGVDDDGFDWQTADTWASRRAALGFADPVPIRYWEIGNEIYGAVESAGAECAPWGWEKVATCDGVEYMLGVDGQAGVVEYADAMRAVDPTIQIGVVGVAPAGAWSNFGNEVLAHAAGVADFYIVHWYGFDASPALDRVPGAARDHWPDAMAALNDALAEWALADLTVAVTEYNLISFRAGDTDAVMRSAANAFFTAEAIGEMALGGVDVANQWNLFDGEDERGTSYGLVDADSGAALPALFGFRAWSLMGDTLRPLVVDDAVEAYATSTPDGAVQVLLLNPSADRVPVVLGVDGGAAAWTVTADTMTATGLGDRTVSYNGALAESVLGLELDPVDLGGWTGDVGHELEPFSITVLRLTPA